MLLGLRVIPQSRHYLADPGSHGWRAAAERGEELSHCNTAITGAVTVTLQ